MINQLKALYTQPFVRFLLAGGLAAIANFGSRFIFNQWLNYEQAIILAYLLGMMVAFLLMRSQVFKGTKKPMMPQIGKFIGINVLALVQTFIISILLEPWFTPMMGVATAQALAHLVGVLVPVITSYFGHKYITFH